MEQFDKSQPNVSCLSGLVIWSTEGIWSAYKPAIASNKPQIWFTLTRATLYLQVSCVREGNAAVEQFDESQPNVSCPSVAWLFGQLKQYGAHTNQQENQINLRNGSL